MTQEDVAGTGGMKTSEAEEESRREEDGDGTDETKDGIEVPTMEREGKESG